MHFETRQVALTDIAAMRDIYRQEMNCQIIHDSIHDRRGWSREYAFIAGGAMIGYGSLAIAGPWKDKPTIYEYFVLPQFRAHVFDLFTALLAASGAVMIETQSNDGLLAVMIHVFANDVETESILFHDTITTHLPAPQNAVFRKATRDDRAKMAAAGVDDAGWLVSVGDEIAASGDILYHYNRPYGDIYMSVAERFRRCGLGAYIVQELKRVCYEGGSVPAARCNPNNIPSRKTLAKAGFVPCGHILHGTVRT
jgi:GNAT superfamily N-acetyltransferase